MEKKNVIATRLSEENDPIGVNGGQWDNRYDFLKNGKVKLDEIINESESWRFLPMQSIQMDKVSL